METSGRGQIRGGAEHQLVARPVGGARKGEWGWEVGVVGWIRGGVWMWAWSVICMQAWAGPCMLWA